VNAVVIDRVNHAALITIKRRRPGDVLDGDPHASRRPIDVHRDRLVAIGRVHQEVGAVLACFVHVAP
jgi:hypothetical protein